MNTDKPAFDRADAADAANASAPGELDAADGLTQVPEPVAAGAAEGQSRLISRVLSPAVRLWLRAQVERVDDLSFQIEGGDRQLLAGHIPQVSISACNAIYRGLYLSQLQLTGANIRVNLGQVLRGKPLRLLAIVPLQGEITLREQDLNTSLQSDLLAGALAEFCATLLQSELANEVFGDLIDASADLRHPKILLAAGRLTLTAELQSAAGSLTPLTIRTGVELVNGRCLRLDQPHWLPHVRAQRGLPLADLHGFEIDLGPDVYLSDLVLDQGYLRCRGQINVIPAE